MSRIVEPSEQDLREWDEWVRSRPESVRQLAARFDPWSLYRMKSTGRRVTLIAFSEDGTLRVAVSGKFNLVMFEREVFGIDPDDLEPCEPPRQDEHIGAVLTNETSIDAYIQAERAQKGTG